MQLSLATSKYVFMLTSLTEIIGYTEVLVICTAKKKKKKKKIGYFTILAIFTTYFFFFHFKM